MPQIIGKARNQPFPVLVELAFKRCKTNRFCDFVKSGLPFSAILRRPRIGKFGNLGSPFLWLLSFGEAKEHAAGNSGEFESTSKGKKPVRFPSTGSGRTEGKGWIPAFAGMTEETSCRAPPGKLTLFPWQPVPSPPRNRIPLVVIIQLSLEPMQHIEHFGKPRLLQRLPSVD
jgi:hypothetical protein